MTNSVSWNPTQPQYNASGNQDESQASWTDLGSNPLDLANPVLGGYHAIMGRSRWSAEQGRYEQAQNLADQNARIAAYRQRGQQIDALNNQQSVYRNNSLSNLDQAFSDGSRQRDRQTEYQTNLAAAMGDLGQQYQTGSRMSGQQMARQGLLGGSADASAQAGLQNQYRTGVAGAVGSGMQRMRGEQNADQQQYHDLRLGLLSGDPAAQARYGAMAAGEYGAAQRAAGMYGLDSAGAALRQQSMDNTSQAIGGMADMIGRAYQSRSAPAGGGGGGGYGYSGGYGY